MRSLLAAIVASLGLVPATLATAGVPGVTMASPPAAAAWPSGQPASAGSAGLSSVDVTLHGVWPLHPRPVVVRGFEPPGSPWGPGHRGVDLLGRAGQAVHASLAGRVSFAGTLAGLGVVAVSTGADHGATRTTYEPVSPTVRVGDVIPRDAVIGHLETVGSHCPPRACLHWGLIRGRSDYLDPLVLVGEAPVRLLPLVGDPSGDG